MQADVAMRRLDAEFSVSQVPVFDEMNLHVNKFILDFYNKGIRVAEDKFLCRLENLAVNGFVDKGDLWERCVPCGTTAGLLVTVRRLLSRSPW